jgi:hypothetical protein
MKTIAKIEQPFKGTVQELNDFIYDFTDLSPDAVEAVGVSNLLAFYPTIERNSYRAERFVWREVKEGGITKSVQFTILEGILEIKKITNNPPLSMWTCRAYTEACKQLAGDLAKRLEHLGAAHVEPFPVRPNVPQRPNCNASREEWFRYYLNCKKAGIKRTHADTAKELNLSEGTVRQDYAKWKAGQES